MDREIVIQLCTQLKGEAEKIIEYIKGSGDVIRSGAEGSVDTVSLFEEMIVRGVENCQDLTLALANCFFQKEKEEQE